MSGRKLSALEQRLHQAALADPKKTLSQKEVETLIPDAASRMDAINFLLGTGLFKAMKDTKGVLSFRVVAKKEIEVKKDMTGEEGMVLSHIQASGNEGIWTKHLKAKTELHQTIIDRCIKSLTQKQLIKAVKSVKYPTRKIYMLFHLDPSVEMTGGPWYTDNELDTEFIKLLCSACLRFIRDRSFPKQKATEVHSEHNQPLYPISAAPPYPTAQQILTFLSKSRITETQLNVEHVEMLLNVLVLDGEIEEIPAFGAAMWGLNAHEVESESDEERESKKRKEKASSSRKRKRSKSSQSSGSESEYESDDGREQKTSSRKKKKKKKKGVVDDTDESESERKPKPKKKRRKKDMSDADESEGERKPQSKKRNEDAIDVDDNDSERKRKKRRKKEEVSDTDESESERKPKKKRRRLKESDDSDSDENKTKNNNRGKSKGKKRQHASESESENSESNSSGLEGDKNRSRSKSKTKSRPRSSSPPAMNEIRADYGAYVYRAVRQEHTAPGLAQAPCTRCPTFDFCKSGGPVDPKGCMYYGEWLIMESVGEE
ncbi:uncharacterized protein LAESUDRAFT_815967 [Laetiporus sulphureus 93-53]|uniref:RNA polymerase Rpc34 n=1 Tax=Laetiporus sulphureus 93-53 TaxID=1314785 RepID=A0A165BN84_9APHY|nr:uncharacterized protein LAESUDRAFT_815967 [Laetiporus sulphureus 93-53]KZT01349.1 hypothetical protein LAESUDRAFT_815967 [Laetiporus sulphureus 93-53]